MMIFSLADHSPFTYTSRVKCGVLICVKHDDIIEVEEEALAAEYTVLGGKGI